MLGETTEQAKQIMKMLHVGKFIDQEGTNGLRMFGSDPVNGYIAELETGKLGLVKA